MSAHKIVPYSVLNTYVEYVKQKNNDALQSVLDFFNKHSHIEVFIIPEPQTSNEVEIRKYSLKDVEGIITENGSRMIHAKSREAEIIIRQAHQSAQGFHTGVFAGALESAIHG